MGLLARLVESAFFSTDARHYWRPENYGLRGENFEAVTDSGNRLCGLVIHPRVKTGAAAGGTVLFFHAAQFNHEFAVPQAVFLALAGYAVILFDYSGCGISTGETTLDGLPDDCLAVLRWLDASPLGSQQYLFFGQGVGADAALQLCEHAPGRACGLILESAYSSRRGWVKDRWGPIIGDIAAAALKLRTRDPGGILAEIKAPVLLIFPGKDTFLHSGERRAMTADAPDHAEIWTVPEAKYLGIFAGAQGKWHQSALRFIKDAFAKRSG